MRKIFLVVLLTFLTSSCVFAAVDPVVSQNSSKSCIVVVGRADVKTEDFMNIVSTTFNNPNIVVGSTIQNMYLNYWLSKGFLEEQEAKKENLQEFVKYSGYEKCLFLNISSPIVESGGGANPILRSSIEVRAYLADENNIIKVSSTTNKGDSMASDLRAKRAALQACMKDLHAQFSYDLSKKVLV